jgi:hypothetical protein|tara:strand:+ start:406 stop:804 length:399 start_codon:yes stop_codon:yes gene_type:complete
LADKFNDIHEMKYASAKKEPLGKSFSRQYDWPATAEKGAINFGVPTRGLENAKEILYPLGGSRISDDPTITAMYRNTHGNFAPGEQKVRDYNWQFDPKEHAFGYGEKRMPNGAANAVHHERMDEAYPKTIIV